jgi:Zn-finger nucleic acid-binding protein
MMLCPICKTVGLVMAERQGIEIDYCPACRGVWLDRGELDKIIERAIKAEEKASTTRTAPLVQESSEPVRQSMREPMPGEWIHGGYREHHDSHRHDEHAYAQQGHRGSFWKELFD